MARRRQRRRRWTPEEDNVLKRLKTEHPDLSWGRIPQLGNLDRDAKSCSHRWKNYMHPVIDRGEFFQEEDEIIIFLNCECKLRWASMTKYLPGRPANAIKNRWSNHLKESPLIDECAYLIPNLDPNAVFSIPGPTS